MKDKGRSSSGLELKECNLFNYLQKMQNHSMQEVALLGNYRSFHRKFCEGHSVIQV